MELSRHLQGPAATCTHESGSWMGCRTGQDDMENHTHRWRFLVVPPVLKSLYQLSYILKAKRDSQLNPTEDSGLEVRLWASTWRYSLRSSAETTVMTEVSCFPQSLQTNIGIMHRLGNDRFLSSSSAILPTDDIVSTQRRYERRKINIQSEIESRWG
jgi:hypothetical protein